MNIIFVLLFSLTFAAADADYVKFTLHNSSDTSIPLRIPAVMNPNLSPYSNSGVNLKVGQEVFFFVKKKKYLLFTVDKSYEGKTLNVPKLIKKRKKELQL